MLRVRRPGSDRTRAARQGRVRARGAREDSGLRADPRPCGKDRRQGRRADLHRRARGDRGCAGAGVPRRGVRRRPLRHLRSFGPDTRGRRDLHHRQEPRAPRRRALHPRRQRDLQMGRGCGRTLRGDESRGGRSPPRSSSGRVDAARIDRQASFAGGRTRTARLRRRWRSAATSCSCRCRQARRRRRRHRRRERPERGAAGVGAGVAAGVAAAAGAAVVGCRGRCGRSCSSQSRAAAGAAAICVGAAAGAGSASVACTSCSVRTAGARQ